MMDERMKEGMAFQNRSGVLKLTAYRTALPDSFIELVETLLSTPRVYIQDKAALQLYRNKKIDFVDAWNIQYANLQPKYSVPISSTPAESQEWSEVWQWQGFVSPWSTP